MRRLRQLAAAFLLLPLPVAHAAGSTVLDYATHTSFAEPAGAAEYRRALQVAEGELRRQDVPPSDCSRALGAARYAELHADVAEARTATGNVAGATAALRQALGCAPRAPWLLANLAANLMSLGRLDEARATALRGIAIAPDNASLNDVLAQADFVGGRQGDAAPRILRAIDRNGESAQAAYWRMLLWLSQRRAAREGEEAGEESVALEPPEELSGWPLPLLDLFRQRATEREVLAAIEDERDERRRREMLCEALYYLGELHLADGRPELARRHFAAAVAVDVPYFVEHRLARAELARLATDR